MPSYQRGEPMTLAVGATLTTDVPFFGSKFVGLDIDSTVTGTLLTLQVQHNGTYDSPATFADVIGQTGTAITFVPVVGGKSVSLIAATTAYVPQAGARIRIKSNATQASSAATITPIFEV